MPESFKAAMPYPIKFSTSENEYEDQDRFPQKFSMFIKALIKKFLFALCNFDNKEKRKIVKVCSKK